MESPHALRQRVHREVQLKGRLHLATTRLDDANRERIWAVVAAHKAGLSIRQIAEATALSSSRVHQLLHDNEAREIPDWLDDLRAPETAAADPSGTGKNASSQILLSTEVAILRRCIDWLKELESEQWVVEDLRAITEVGEERVLLNRSQVLRVLSRIAAELDALAGRPAPGSQGAAMDEMDLRQWLRERMPGIDAPRRQREERVASRKAANLVRWGTS
jgi:hypothetical protein